jgi:hypothetical protein
MVTRILLALLVLTGVANAQAQQIEIGIYAPSAPFETSQQRLAYVQNLAKAIEQQTGIKTVASQYASLDALRKAKPNYAIVEGVCVATNGGWQVLANAQIGGSTARAWGLFASGASNMQQLKGKKLAYMKTDCSDSAFIDNAMLDTEVDPKFWGSRVGEKDINAAVAAVASYKTAQAVFAPVTEAKGLTKVFDTGTVPNPAFVELNAPAGGVSSKVASAVQGYGAQGAISGWSAPNRGPYSALNGALQPVRKSGIFAQPESVRLDSKQILNDPTTLKDSAFVAVRHHWLRPASGRME